MSRWGQCCRGSGSKEMEGTWAPMTPRSRAGPPSGPPTHLHAAVEALFWGLSVSQACPLPKLIAGVVVKWKNQIIHLKKYNEDFMIVKQSQHPFSYLPAPGHPPHAPLWPISCYFPCHTLWATLLCLLLVSHIRHPAALGSLPRSALPCKPTKLHGKFPHLLQGFVQMSPLSEAAPNHPT